MIRLGVIGYGHRASGMTDLMAKQHEQVRVTAIADPRWESLKSAAKERGHDPDLIRFYADADEMLSKADIDAVYIGTRCSKHAGMAVKVLKTGLPLFLEKPVATNMEDLSALRDAYLESKSKVMVSFPLRVSPLTEVAKRIIDSGRLGEINHVQAWNYVPYGQVYFQTWYRDENETQGLFLQKATHDFDYINFLLGVKPVSLCAMSAKLIYKGTKPACKLCSECSEKDSCLESPFNPEAGGHGLPPCDWDTLKCAFAVDTGNEDSGSAIIRYSNGMHVNYTQNFFARKKAAKRGATLSGYNGTLEFDFYTNQIRVFGHQQNIVETYDVDAAGGHGGGDGVLCDAFVKMVEGKADSISRLDDGLLSALMCLKAKESAATDTFQEIAWPKS
jgi:predicted dehydrogenase